MLWADLVIAVVCGLAGALLGYRVRRRALEACLTAALRRAQHAHARERAAVEKLRALVALIEEDAAEGAPDEMVQRPRPGGAGDAPAR